MMMGGSSCSKYHHHLVYDNSLREYNFGPEKGLHF